MAERIMSVHEQRVFRIAQEYERRGWEVTVQPSSEQLPDFLSEFHPDILARSNGGGIVVEVASPKRANEDWGELARVIEGRPEWRLDPVLSDQRADQELPADVETLARPAIDKYLANSEALVVSGATAPAMLTAWVAMEAALRRAIQKDETPIRAAGSTAVISTAYSNGWLDREDYDDLMKLYRKRNEIVHGYQSDVQIVDVERVRALAASVLEDAGI